MKWFGQSGQILYYLVIGSVTILQKNKGVLSGFKWVDVIY